MASYPGDSDDIPVSLKTGVLSPEYIQNPSLRAVKGIDILIRQDLFKYTISELFDLGDLESTVCFHNSEA